MEPLSAGGVITATLAALWPVWLGLVVIFALSITFQKKLGLYGKLFYSPIGMIGFGFVMFWILTAIFANWIAPFGPLEQISGMRLKTPGTPFEQEGLYVLWGTDILGRDMFSRVVYGAQIVLVIAPLATLFAYVIGILLGLPAGYYSGRTDAVLSFIANLILSFPVILLMFLFVTPGIRDLIIVDISPDQSPQPRDILLPEVGGGIILTIALVFLLTLLWSRFRTRPGQALAYMAIPVVLWVVSIAIVTFNLSEPLAPPPEVMVVFVMVVFVNAPTMFRIVRGITLDISTRDYVAAAQTRGERPWYIMLWEILPNARGPVIVDFSLRIGYTTILLGTLGFFGIGLGSESPDWGLMINDGRRFLSSFPHMALPPAFALMSLVLGLNLLADGLREESLKD